MTQEGASAELFQFLGNWCDGGLDDAACRRLEEILASSPSARQVYIEYLDMHARLICDRRSPVLVASLLTRFNGSLSDVEFAGSCRCPTSPIATRSRRNSRRAIGFGAAVAAAVVVLALSVAWHMPRAFWGENAGDRPAGPRQAQGSTIPGGSAAASPSAAAPADDAAPTVAHLRTLAGCRWADSHLRLRPGQALAAGRILRLSAGVAEVFFDVGVKVVVQAPAVLEIESAKSARLESGKLSAEVTTVAARGFQIRTPQGTFVDQGTEFGVEVTPDGNSRLHVFKGEVDVKPAVAGPASLPHRVLAKGEARLDQDSQSMTLLEDTGDSFIRTVDAADRDRHVVAYWRFEDRPLGVVVPNTQQNKRSARATTDSSFNGNDLFAYSDLSHPSFSGDVPSPIVPSSGQPNRGCLDNSEPPPRVSRDFYTHSAFSHAAPLDLQTIVPRQWTIEASIRPARLQCGNQTFIGRDGNEPGAATIVPTRLAFQINAKDRLAIWYVDQQERRHQVVVNELELQVGQWYHLAATSDGETLKLYVDALDGRGYQLLAAKQLPSDGLTAMSKGSDGAEWSLGRGKVRNHVAENFQGWIDEVRISDIARDPDGFLFSKPSEGLAD